MTWIVDILWIFYWVPVWFSDEMKDWQKGVHSFVAFFSIINFFLKVRIITADRGHDHARNVAERQHQEESHGTEPSLIKFKLKSRCLSPVHPLRLSRDDATVGLARSESVYRHGLPIRGHPLLLVVRTPVSDHDLGRVLVRHYNCRLGQPVPEAERVVRLQRFLRHSSVQILSVRIG